MTKKEIATIRAQQMKAIRPSIDIEVTTRVLMAGMSKTELELAITAKNA